jgi:hypothetical protein
LLPPFDLETGEQVVCQPGISAGRGRQSACRRLHSGAPYKALPRLLEDLTTVKNAPVDAGDFVGALESGSSNGLHDLGVCARRRPHDRDRPTDGDQQRQRRDGLRPAQGERTIYSYALWRNGSPGR